MNFWNWMDFFGEWFGEWFGESIGNQRDNSIEYIFRYFWIFNKKHWYSLIGMKKIILWRSRCPFIYFRLVQFCAYAPAGMSTVFLYTTHVECSRDTVCVQCVRSWLASRILRTTVRYYQRYIELHRSIISRVRVLVVLVCACT